MRLYSGASPWYVRKGREFRVQNLGIVPGLGESIALTISGGSAGGMALALTFAEWKRFGRELRRVLKTGERGDVFPDKVAGRAR